MRQARKQGWKTKRGKGHVQCYSPDGETIITVAVSTSKRSAYKGVEHQFKKAGVRLD